MIKVLTDQNLHKISLFIPKEAELTFYNPQHKTPDLTGFDALLIRTVTKLNEHNFPKLPSTLKLVGTGSSGSDHVDIEYLLSKGVHFSDAKGCNASAVAEYVLTSLLLWGVEKQVELSDLSFGIIGAGKTGTAVSNLLEKFEASFYLYDPPREKIDPEFTSCSLEEVLRCDVLSFHVPLIHSGEYSTFHWLDKVKLVENQFKLIINASRGGVIDESALKQAIDTGTVDDCVIDVWENEPDFDPKLAKQAFIATPHIAGYSEQAKLNASRLVCEKLCRFFHLDMPTNDLLSQAKNIELAHLKYSLGQLLSRLHPIREYDAILRDLMNREDKATLFSKLRTDRPYRYEYSYMNLDDEFLDRFKELELLGIKSRLRTE